MVKACDFVFLVEYLVSRLYIYIYLRDVKHIHYLKYIYIYQNVWVILRSSAHRAGGMTHGKVLYSLRSDSSCSHPTHLCYISTSIDYQVGVVVYCVCLAIWGSFPQLGDASLEKPILVGCLNGAHWVEAGRLQANGAPESSDLACNN